MLYVVYHELLGLTRRTFDSLFFFYRRVLTEKDGEVSLYMIAEYDINITEKEMNEMFGFGIIVNEGIDFNIENSMFLLFRENKG